MKVKIIVDSASDLKTEDLKKLNITRVPIEVRFGDEEYLDGETLSASDFYTKLAENPNHPQTSLINGYKWSEVFTEALKDADEVVAITLSSGISGTYQAALESSKDFGGKVFVVDSRNATIGEGILAKVAAKLAIDGKSGEEIKTELDKLKTRIKVFAGIDTLKYLKKGGRISAATAFFGEALNFKPIIWVIDGEVKMKDKARGVKKAVGVLINTIEATNGIDVDLPFAIICSGNDHSNADKFAEEASHLWKDAKQEAEKYCLGSTIGTHIGAGAFGIAYFEK